MQLSAGLFSETAQFRSAFLLSGNRFVFSCFRIVSSLLENMIEFGRLLWYNENHNMMPEYSFLCGYAPEK